MLKNNKISVTLDYYNNNCDKFIEFLISSNEEIDITINNYSTHSVLGIDNIGIVPTQRLEEYYKGEPSESENKNIKLQFLNLYSEGQIHINNL
jgi:hypothetical protein